MYCIASSAIALRRLIMAATVLVQPLSRRLLGLDLSVVSSVYAVFVLS